jgi:hypothetical protein
VLRSLHQLKMRQERKSLELQQLVVQQEAKRPQAPQQQEVLESLAERLELRLRAEQPVLGEFELLE